MGTEVAVVVSGEHEYIPRRAPVDYRESYHRQMLWTWKSLHKEHCILDLLCLDGSLSLGLCDKILVEPRIRTTLQRASASILEHGYL